MTSIITTPLAPAEMKQSESLRVIDRCDRCNAQAYVRVENKQYESTLDFCGHHLAKFEAGLLGAGFVITIDDRHLLTWDRAKGEVH